jgi:hypothetical protein
LRKIIFVNRYFFPDHSATSQILSDLAFNLAADGVNSRPALRIVAMSASLPNANTAALFSDVREAPVADVQPQTSPKRNRQKGKVRLAQSVVR